MNPTKIGVIGAGLMGHGIAYLLAAAGHTVRIYDPSAEWRTSLAARLKSARDLLDGDPALLDRTLAHIPYATAVLRWAHELDAEQDATRFKHACRDLTTKISDLMTLLRGPNAH